MSKRQLPYFFLYLRLVLGLFFPIYAYFQFPFYSWVGIFFLVVGLLSDVLDGMLARKFGVSSEKFRRLDSNIDQVFYLGMLAGMFVHSSLFFAQNLWQIVGLVSLEVSIYLVSFLRFKKEVATHSWGAKLWSISLVVTFIDVIVNETSGTVFLFCFWLGTISRLEIIAILFTLREWTNDVPTIFHAVQLRKGKEIKRSKWLNG